MVDYYTYSFFHWDVQLIFEEHSIQTCGARPCHHISRWKDFATYHGDQSGDSRGREFFAVERSNHFLAISFSPRYRLLKLSRNAQILHIPVRIWPFYALWISQIFWSRTYQAKGLSEDWAWAWTVYSGRVPSPVTNLFSFFLCSLRRELHQRG